MTKIVLVPLFTVIALAVPVIFFFAYGRENTWAMIAGNPDLGPVDFKTLHRSRKPNDALVCSQGACPTAVKIDHDLPLFDKAPRDIIEAIERKVSAGGEPYLRADDRSDSHTIRFIMRTPFMRFPDTVEFSAQTTKNGKTSLIGYSRSQLGYSDTGTNLRRLKRLTSDL